MARQQTLSQVAKQLHHLAEQLAAGIIEVDGSSLPVDKAVKIKVKQKFERHRLKFDLSLVVDLAKSSDHHPVGSPVVSPRAGNKGHGKRPYEVKRQKKTISALWKEVAMAASKGVGVDQATSRQLLTLCDEYGTGAATAWSVQWQQCLLEIRACLAAMQIGDFGQALIHVETVKRQTKQCHKQYK